MSGISVIQERPFIVFGKPDVGEAEKKAVNEVIDSGWLSTGIKCTEFEDEFKKFIGCNHAVAVSSCTEGIILALLSCWIGHGDEVITSPLTFAATVNAIIAVGARPVFVDVTPSGHLNPDLIEQAITKKTKAIIPVHYTGAACEMFKIKNIAEKNGLKLIEDAAHSFVGHYVRDSFAWVQGTIGDFGCFSFYPTKNVTCGEGGMIVMKESHHEVRTRLLSMQGLSAGSHRRYGKDYASSYQVVIPGRKSNLSDIHAAIGLAQIKRWPELREKRNFIWQVYEDAFGSKGPGHSQHLFTIEHENRDGLRQHLHEQGIGTGIHFNPLHLEPAYSYLGHKKGAFPIAERIGQRTISLPVSSTMVTQDAVEVVDAVKQYKGN